MRVSSKPCWSWQTGSDDALQRTLARQLQERFPDRTPQLQLLDRDAFATIRRLIDAGVLHANPDTARTLYRAPAADTPRDDGPSTKADRGPRPSGPG